MNSLVKTVLAFSHWLNRICWVGSGTFLVLMLVAVGVQVIARYLLFSAPPWTEEMARYCMVWAGLLGATVSFHERQDPVVISVIDDNGLKGQLAEAGRGITTLILILPIIFYSPVVISHHMLRMTDSLHITSGYVLLIVPVFAWIVLIHQLARLLGVFFAREPGPTIKEESS